VVVVVVSEVVVVVVVCGRVILFLLLPMPYYQTSISSTRVILVLDALALMGEIVYFSGKVAKAKKF
jgi:hypothetical protein